MGGTGGLPAEQHAPQQGRHPGGFPETELVLTGRNADDFRGSVGNAYERRFGHHVKAFFVPTSQSVVSGVTTAYNREQLWLANETLITKLQARCRGYLVRKGLKERMEYLKSNEAAVTNIQVIRTL